MKVVSVVGVRPEFVMASPVSDALANAGHEEVLVHTGQHYDELLSDVFFRELDLPSRTRELGVGSAPRHQQIHAMTDGIEAVVTNEQPDVVLVYGDTNSTCAGAMAAATSETPLAHVEAGVRSFDRSMPEERNRLLTDRLADLLLAPTRAAVTNLSRAGLYGTVRRIGDVRRDALATVRDATARTTPHESLPVEPGEYVLATVHRKATVTDPGTLRSVFRGLANARSPVVVPLHPNTADRLRAAGVYSRLDSQLNLVDPVGYPAFVRLLEQARCVATDSGGVQREAMMLGTPCVTIRERTEWPETVSCGSNVLVGTDADAIREEVDRAVDRSIHPIRPPTGVSRRIVRVLGSAYGDRSVGVRFRKTGGCANAPGGDIDVSAGWIRQGNCGESGDESRLGDRELPREAS